METLKVGTKSNPNSVAGALANVFREKGSVEIQAIGAGALNQAIKAIAIARGFVAPSGKNLVCIPAFTDIVIDEEEKTAIRLDGINGKKKINVLYCADGKDFEKEFSFEIFEKSEIEIKVPKHTVVIITDKQTD